MSTQLVWAAAGAWQGDADASARLIAARSGVGDGDKVDVGLQIRLGEGWHTYWRTPGMAGLPPQLDWTQSQSDTGNVKTATLLYPAPKRYTDFGLETIGYRKGVVFPVDVTLAHPGQAARLQATVNILVCNQTCVPKTFNLSLSLVSGDGDEGAEADVLKAARAAVPQSRVDGLTIDRVERKADSLSFHVKSDDDLASPDIFVENDKDIEFAAPLITWEEGHHAATLTVKPTDKLPDGVSLTGLPITATLVDGNRALEIHDDHAGPAALVTKTGDAATPPTPSATQGDGVGASTSAPSIGLQYALVLALLGGFILNLMPCVLPVLSIKVLSLIKHGGGEETHVRRSFIVTATGIIFSFLAMGCATMIVKQAGQAVGWGVQFQQPVFLIGLVLVLSLFAANMWDWLQIQLPYHLADRLGLSENHPKLLGDFLTGAFATLLATPCTAPFLGTAVGFALSAGSGEILLIFAALGIGMASPYLAVAVLPKIAVCLPRPGVWMVALRRVLGVALALTALWLLWVLAAQIRLMDVAVLAFGVSLFVACLVYGQVKPAKRAGVVAIVALFCLVFAAHAGDGMKPQVLADHQWQVFDESQIPSEVAEGRTVFVDVTASWCLTCKANKKFVLSRPEVAAHLFGRADVVPMQADWTNPNPKIAAYLQKYGRFGIPFDIVYSPRHPQGVLLPELLSTDTVLSSIQ
ncbi:MAG: thioredoxin family protein [Alphaproteobacteria bacterium]|nr:thioredoxin family protein [Alphaproteobacteria bacterium]